MEEKEQQETTQYANDFSGRAATDAAQLAALAGRSQRSLNESFFRKNRNRIIAVCAVILLALGVGIWQLRKKATSVNSAVGSSAVAVQIPAGSDHVFVNDVSGVSTSPAAPAGSADTTSMGSENFQLKEVTFGTGSVALQAGESENDPLAISNVHSQVMTGTDEGDVKLLITWDTNKLARATVNYDKGGPQTTLAEGGYGFSHALVLADLDRATRYTFTIVGTDRWGNTAHSDTFNTYIGQKSASVFDLISQQFSAMFGWAIKK